jgi:hypothetical protein
MLLIRTFLTQLPSVEGKAFDKSLRDSQPITATFYSRQFCRLQAYMDLGVFILDQSFRPLIAPD